MMFKQITCPTCGNTISAKSVDEPQRCRYCKRPFKVKLKRLNKFGQRGKYYWDVESIHTNDNE